MKVVLIVGDTGKEIEIEVGVEEFLLGGGLAQRAEPPGG